MTRAHNRRLTNGDFILDWDMAIARNRLPLMRIALALVALLASSKVAAGAGLFVPRSVWRSAAAVLRSAEAAARRLIIIAAHALPPVPFTLRRLDPDAISTPSGSAHNLRSTSFEPTGDGTAMQGAQAPHAFVIAPVFRLTDPLKRYGPFFSEDGDAFEAFGAYETYGVWPQDEFSHDTTPDDEPVNAVCLHNRLRALCLALNDLPAQARRLARFHGRRDVLIKAGRPARLGVMRPGLPPGWRERGKHEIDPILKECHRLVRYLEDTS